MQPAVQNLDRSPQNKTLFLCANELKMNTKNLKCEITCLRITRTLQKLMTQKKPSPSKLFHRSDLQTQPPLAQNQHSLQTLATGIVVILFGLFHRPTLLSLCSSPKADGQGAPHSTLGKAQGGCGSATRARPVWHGGPLGRPGRPGPPPHCGGSGDAPAVPVERWGFCLGPRGPATQGPLREGRGLDPLLGQS